MAPEEEWLDFDIADWTFFCTFADIKLKLESTWISSTDDPVILLKVVLKTPKNSEFLNLLLHFRCVLCNNAHEDYSNQWECKVKLYERTKNDN